MSEKQRNESRLRPHPETRFNLPQIAIDLNSVAARLRAEVGSGERGHRQETLYRGENLTVALFLFQRFTELSPHRAKGIINIQVLRGRLKITAENQVHELGPGQMLILAPGVEHAVAAEQEGEMLLTVKLVGS